jgi:glycosyltransferase involved in cell wall biosynthesis
MKIAVVSPSPVPFRRGGAERLFSGLTRAFEQAGHAAELIKLPVRELTLADLVDSYQQFARLDLSHFDLVVSGKYPAWMIDHPRHVVWMLHPLRGLYDTYPVGNFVDTRLPDTPEVAAIVSILDRTAAKTDVDDLIAAVLDHVAVVGPSDPNVAIPSPLAREVVHRLDRIALDRHRVRQHAAISATVAGRTDYFPPDVEAVVLHPPVAMSNVDAVPVGDVLVTASRLERVKRVDLIIEAFADVPGKASLVIAGEGPDEQRLRELASPDPRVSFVGRVGDDELSELYGRARAVVFCPRDEDYGYIAAEAMAQGRAVVTTTDAGGPTELVTDGVGGLVVEPEREALTAAMSRLVDDRGVAQIMGDRARDAMQGIRWDRVVEGLLARRRPRSSKADRIIAVSTYPVYPQQAGGPLRAKHLLAGLCVDGDREAEIISVSPTAASIERHQLAPHVSETVVPLSARATDAETELRLVTGPVAITDVATGLMWKATPALARELATALEDAAAAIFVQPYLAPAVLELAPELPSVCDEHNHERAMKSGMYPANEGGAWMLGRVQEIERAAVRSSALMTATTEADLASIVAEYHFDRDRAGVVPNGVDTSAIEFVVGEERARRRATALGKLGLHPSTRVLALFVGSGHAPNIDAGRSIIASATTLPHVEFLLVGRHSEELHRSKLPPNIHLLGRVSDDDLDLFLTAADVALNPIRTGGGSNLKLLSYLASGLPVITTPVGARGIDAAEAGVLVCDLDRLGEAIERIEGPERAIAGRAWVEANADWKAISVQFSELFDKFVLS